VERKVKWRFDSDDADRREEHRFFPTRKTRNFIQEFEQKSSNEQKKDQLLAFPGKDKHNPQQFGDSRFVGGREKLLDH
jgi:hypothetical protein